MKKVLSLIIVMLMMLPTPLQGAKVTTSMETYSQGKIVSGDVLAKEVVLNDNLKGVMAASKEGLEFIGNDDFKIAINQPIISFEVVADYNQDGYKDVAVTLNVGRGYNNFLVVSTKDSKILYATKLTHKTTDENGNIVIENSLIRQVLSSDKMLYLIYDYHLLGIDVNKQEVIFDYEGKDNLWKMVMFEQQIIFTNQLGELVSIDKDSGKENYCHQLTAVRKIKNPYSNNGVEEVNLNLWDLLVNDNQLYVSSEEDKIYQVDINNGTVINELQLNVLKDKEINKRLSEQSSYSYSQGKYMIYPTGVFSKAFNGYKMKLVKDNLMLVEAYLGDQGYQDIGMVGQNNKGIVPTLLLVDLKEMKVVSKIKLETYNLKASNALLTTYQGQEVLVILNSTNKGILKISIYSIDGKLIGQNSLRNLGIGEDVKVSLSHYGKSYLLQLSGGSTFVLDADLKTIHSLGSSRLVNQIAEMEDGMLVVSNQNGKIDEISKLGWHGKDDVLMSVKVPSTYLNNGFETIKYDEINQQILTLVNEINENGELVASHIVIINMDGIIICDKKVLLAKGYDENNKYFKQYLIGNEISYFKDLNGDGKKEILVDTNIIDGHSFTYRANYQQVVEEKGTIIDAGDLNQDGISDLVNVGDKEMRVYYSLQDGFEISYRKTNIVKKYDESLLNSQYVKVIGDLEHQGVKLFVINARNDEGCQYYQVINPRDLSVRFKLLSGGVYDWGESYSLAEFDLNHDNIDDLIFNGPENSREIISGKDGKIITKLALEKNYDESNAMPAAIDEIIPLDFSDKNTFLYQLTDLNQDGINELGYIYFDYSDTNETKLRILNGQDLKELKICDLDGMRLNDLTLVPVKGTTKVILKDNIINQIYDYQKEILVAGCGVDANVAKGLDDGRILIEETNGQLVIFNDDLDFSLVDFDEKKVNDGDLTVKFKSDKAGMMSVYDQGNLVAKTIEQEVELKLLPGVHRLIFSYDDGQGKVTHITKKVTVVKSSLMRYIVIFISLLMVLIMVMIGYYPKYHLYKKAGVKNGKNN